MSICLLPGISSTWELVPRGWALREVSINRNPPVALYGQSRRG
jgi:hypothetical protein